MLKRTFDAAAVNTIVNHPAVRPTLGGAGYLDLTAVVHDTRNYALFGDHGGIVFARMQDAIYEAHTQVLPEGRGAWTLRMTQDALKMMFCGTEAIEILTQVPNGNRPAKILAQVIHGAYEFTNHVGLEVDGKPVATDVYSLTIQRWMKKAPRLIDRGRWFHSHLEGEYTRLDRDIPTHDDDDDHDRYVGVAVEAILAGWPEKGVALYNRWAALAGYAKINIVSLDPLVLDIVDARLLVENNSFTVI
jgi:hypothetical protein